MGRGKTPLPTGILVDLRVKTAAGRLTLGSTPAVSVILPVYNRTDVVGNAISSVLAQTFSDFELLVVDDGSTVDLAGAVKGLDDPRVQLIRHDTNKGAAAARNTGIDRAKGALVAFIDSDDRWPPEKLAIQVKFLAGADRSVRACCTGFRFWRKGAPDGEIRRFDKRDIGLQEMVWGCIFSPGSTLMAERAVYDDIGRLNEAFRRLEDWEWLLRYVQKYRLGLMDDVLVDIVQGDPPAGAAMEDSLDRLAATHFEGLARTSPGLVRDLRAAIRVERAAQAFREGRMVSVFDNVIRSLALRPVGNKAFSQVILARILGGVTRR